MVRYDGGGAGGGSGNATADFLAQIGTAPSAGSTMSGSSSAASKEPQVYWGQDDTGRMVKNSAGVLDNMRGAGKSKDTLRALSDVQGDFYRWSPDDMARWGQRLAELGIIDAAKATDYATLRDEWFAISEEAANFTTAGKKMTPWDVAGLIGGDSKGGAGGKSSTAFTGTKSTTQKSVDLTDPTTAKALVNDTLSKYLGRNATDEEITSFKNVLNAAEQANPTTTNTSTTYDNGDAVSQSQTSSGGLSSAGKAQVLADEAMKKPDYGAYQSASLYFNALVSALHSPGG